MTFDPQVLKEFLTPTLYDMVILIGMARLLSGIYLLEKRVKAPPPENSTRGQVDEVHEGNEKSEDHETT